MAFKSRLRYRVHTKMTSRSREYSDSFVSAVQTLLKGEFTIEQLLDQDELIQEARHGTYSIYVNIIDVGDVRLIQYLSQEDNLKKLISFALAPLDAASSDTLPLKYVRMYIMIMITISIDLRYISRIDERTHRPR